MIEILWHGRGGQGAFTAARLLGAAASLEDGRYALAFPSFGPERRGAPMRAFTKMSAAPIGDRSAIKRADYVIYLDDTLLGDGWDAELKEGGRVFVNSERAFDDDRVIAIDANRISADILGRPIPNTVFLGALSCVIDGLSEADVKRAIQLYMPAKLHAANEAIVDAARAELAGAPACEEAQDERGDQSGRDGGQNAQNAASSPDEAIARALKAQTGAQRSPQCIPAIEHDALDPVQFAQNTCFAAGHLVAGNAGWRNVRPVIDARACTGCLQCYLYCPDGAIFKTPTREDAGSAAKTANVAIDYEFCKGCGMCVRACKFGAISMVSEPAALAAEAALKSACAKEATA